MNWIDSKKQKPTEGTEVAAWVNFPDAQGYIATGYLDEVEGFWRVDDSNLALSVVTHWMTIKPPLR